MATNQTSKASAWGLLIPAFISAVVLAFFLLIGVPQDKAVPYIGIVVAVTVITFCAAFWMARVLQGVGQSFEGVFRTIGISLVLGVASANLVIVLAYRIYLHRLASEGWLLGFLLLANAFVFLLILGLPWYARFAGGLSRADREQKATVILLTDRLEQIEQDFLFVLQKAGKNITVHDRPPITILREKAQCISPFDSTKTTSADVDSKVLEHIAEIERVVREGKELPLDDIERWGNQVRDLCDTTMKLLQRREKLMLV